MATTTPGNWCRKPERMINQCNFNKLQTARKLPAKISATDCAMHKNSCIAANAMQEFIQLDAD
jgi:hypothetical protein